MMQIVYGATGCGKTTWIVDAILNDLRRHIPVVLIVPEQQSMEAELMLSEAADRADLSTVGLEVLSFSRMANRVFREYGGLSYHYIDRGARALLMWHTLYRLTPVLQEYQNVKLSDKSMLHTLLDTIDRFKQYGVTPAMLEETAVRMEEDETNARLCAKLRDLSLLYASYQELLHVDYDDPADDLTRLIGVLQEHRFFEGRAVYLDSFFGFTNVEFDIMRSILKTAVKTTITLSYVPENKQDLFTPLRETDCRLRTMAEECRCAVCPDVILRTNYRFQASGLRELGKYLWDYSFVEPLTEELPEGITLRECDNVFDEALYIARRILASVQSGDRWRDHVVVVRDVNRWRGIIDAVFERYKIPYFLAGRVEITDKPLIKLILSSLRIIVGHWKCEDVIACLKTGLMPLTEEECDLLEIYTSAWSVSGRQWTLEEEWCMNPDGYAPALTERGKEILRRVNEIRTRITAPLITLADTLHEGCTVRESCEALFRYLSDLSVCEKTEEYGDEESVLLWNTVMDTLDQLVLVAPDAVVNADIFSQLLSLAFEGADFGKIPTSMDQVLIGGAAGIRVSDAKYLHILGANDGIFPASVAEDSIFSDRDLIAMESNGLVLSPTTDLRSIEELLYFYRAATAVSDHLTITYASAEPNGNALQPSQAVQRLLTLFPALRNTLHGTSEDCLYGIFSEEDILDALHPCRGTALGKVLEHYCAVRPNLSGRMATIASKLDEAEQQLTQQTAQIVFPGNLNLTQTQLENYSMCGFSYYCRYVLKLEEHKQVKFGAIDIGNFVHRILELFIGRIRTENGIDCTIDETEMDAILKELIHSYMNPLLEQTSIGVNRLQYLMRRLKRTTKLLLRNLLHEFSQSRFVPTFFELPIAYGNPDTPAPLEVKLSDGSRASVFGKVDRVDTFQKGNDVYVRVVDYKTGTKTFSLSDVEKGLNLQMLLYLFSIWKNAGPVFREHIGCKGEILPAGVLYLSARAPEISLESRLSEEEVLSLTEDKISRKGYLLNDVEVLTAMEREMQGKYIPVVRKKDGSFYAGAPIASLEQFGILMQQVMDSVKKIAEEIKSGCANAIPYRDKQRDACAYCSMKPICRRFDRKTKQM